MDLKQLEYFVRVAELGSFTRASIALDIAQPALSRQVRLLEVELRQTLLNRNGRGVTPTNAGSLLLEHGRGILYQMERLREELERARGQLAGRTALGLPPSLSKTLTLPLIHAFSARYPEASLSISEGLSASMREGLLSGRLDLALLYNPPASSDLALTPFFEQELFFVERRQADRPDPLSVAVLADAPLVIPSRPNAIRMTVERALADVGLCPRIVLEIDVVPAILELVAEGIGGAVLSRTAVPATAAPALQLRPFSPALHIGLFLASSTHRPETQVQRIVTDLLAEIARPILQEQETG